jgi:hypothetical protein
MKKAIADTLTVEYSKTPGKTFQRKVLSKFKSIFSLYCENPITTKAKSLRVMRGTPNPSGERTLNNIYFTMQVFLCPDVRMSRVVLSGLNNNI